MYICNPLKRNFIEIKIYCGMEQLAARWAHNPKVVGSSPAPATKPEDFSYGFFDHFNFEYLVCFLYIAF
jgi:hypothetical protein